MNKKECEELEAGKAEGKGKITCRRSILAFYEVSQWPAASQDFQSDRQLAK